MYKHEHIYVYQFELKNHSSWPGKSTCRCEYSLCTNITGHDHKHNRTMLEEALRIVYGHMPKGVKFLHEKIQG